jgi:thiamine kinase-like enzyme
MADEAAGAGNSIGSGLYGNVRAAEHGMVTKKVSFTTGIREQSAAEILKGIDPEQEYTIYGTKFKKFGLMMYITMPHGGTDLGKLIAAAETKNEKILEQFKPEIPGILKGIDRLLKWMPTMHNAGLFHNDIGPQNMVWDGSKLRFIDWGLAFIDTDIDGLESIKSDIREIQSTLKGGGRRRMTRNRKER